jgi:hypothetical protein
MSNKDFIFSVNTLVGCKYSILKELEAEYDIEKKYHKKYLLSKGASLITSGLSYFDELRFRSLSRNLEITAPPIYVLGHWRSGTTLLHNLLCSFKNVSYPTTYQTVFPNNLFFLSRLIKGIMQFYLPEKRLIDKVKMHVDFPQEEDFALLNEAGFSFYLWFFFPQDHQRIVDEFLTLSTQNSLKRQKYQQGYMRFVKRCITNVGGNQYVAKNPPNMARIPFLLGLFPGSRFVYIERNPYEVLMSTYKFFNSFFMTLQLQDVEEETVWNFVFDTYVRLHHQYQKDKHLIPRENLIELKYEQLVADPEAVFHSLHKGIFSDLEVDEQKFNSFIQSHQNHSANTYNFEKKFIDRVHAELGNLIEQQGYKQMPV